MGSPATIAVAEDQTGVVYFYSHWDGLAGVTSVVRRALARKQRWNDADYLARIIFCELVRNHETGETGYGISAKHRDGPVVFVDVEKQRVTVGDLELTFTQFLKTK